MRPEPEIITFIFVNTMNNILSRSERQGLILDKSTVLDSEYSLIHWAKEYLLVFQFQNTYKIGIGVNFGEFNFAKNSGFIKIMYPSVSGQNPEPISGVFVHRIDIVAFETILLGYLVDDPPWFYVNHGNPGCCTGIDSAGWRTNGCYPVLY